MITAKGREIIKHNFLVGAGLKLGTTYKFTKIQFGNGNAVNTNAITGLGSPISSSEYTIDLAVTNSIVKIDIAGDSIDITITDFAPNEVNNISELGVFCGDDLFARFVFDPIPVSSTSAVSLTCKMYL